MSAYAVAFDDAFDALTGHPPFPWQRALFERFVGEESDLPSSCDIPTGLGKTAVIAIWLIALGQRPDKLPRRLVYVVNRRTVVDQTTNEVERLRVNLQQNPELEGLRTALRGFCRDASDDELPLAISTLRGQFADNRAWSADPSRPAVIVGTVDMIGSRLLFSGYGVSFKGRPLHAGFLGQDALIVHDEAHLEPAFQRLLTSIKSEQARCRDYRPFNVLELTATSRNHAAVEPGVCLTLSDEDREHPIVKQRIEARKHLALHSATDDRAVAQRIASLAARHKDAGATVLVFVRTLDAVATIQKELAKSKQTVLLLTGTMRGKERDAFVDKPGFRRFLSDAAGGETVYLVCTSAGEVGIDISADHMVCDLSTFESMAQRLGRVNRYGDRGDTQIDVVYPADFDEIATKAGESKADELEQRRRNTLGLLRQLPRVGKAVETGEPILDASPQALRDLMAGLTGEERAAAFSPESTILPATDVLLDAWSLTSIRKPMPGRPAVEAYLHGIVEWEPPETHVAWRQEVEFVVGDMLDRYAPADLLDDFPLLPHELLRDRSDRVFKHLETLASRDPDKPAWLVDARGGIARMMLRDLADKRRKDRIHGCTILLPPSAGGLTDGMLDGASEIADDVAEIPDPLPGVRVRVQSDDPKYATKTAGMRCLRSIELSTTDDDEQPPRWEWYELDPVEGGRTARRAVTLDCHTSDVVHRAEAIVAGLSLSPEIARAVILAAKLHDLGKRRERFQTALGNRTSILLAKSAGRGARLTEPFRHELASVLDAQDDHELKDLSEDQQDVVLHLIAAHHGYARPHFPIELAFDPERTSAEAEALAAEIPRRFARLQRKFGRWGLAYLESLLRAADWAASALPSAFADESEAAP